MLQVFVYMYEVSSLSNCSSVSKQCIQRNQILKTHNKRRNRAEMGELTDYRGDAGDNDELGGKEGTRIRWIIRPHVKGV